MKPGLRFALIAAGLFEQAAGIKGAAETHRAVLPPLWSRNGPEPGRAGAIF